MASSAEVTRAQAAALDGRSIRPSRMRDEQPVYPRAVADRSLASLIEVQIIPRLMMAHGISATTLPLESVAPIAGDDVDALVALALAGDAGGVLAQVEHAIAQGAGIDMIMVELLAPTARRLGTLWEEDRCDFVDVTMGLWRLQEVVRELSIRFSPTFGLCGGERPSRALFAAMPGDQHDFGAVIVSEIFQRHGWDVETAPGADMTEILASAGRHHYDLIGLTVSCDCHSARLPSVILALRSVSRNPGVRIMVGGRVFVGDPGLAERVGADGTAPDALRAVAVAETLVDAVRGNSFAVG